MSISSEKKKVFVGLSGGVDSAVSAALLKQEGADVVGVFIKVWQPDFLPCTWQEDRRDAMRVAATLGIPFLTFDFEEEYKRDVVDYMIAEYKAGKTPNPDVMCNRSIKFGAFLKKAIAMGADFVATGHYARVGGNQSGIGSRENSNKKTLNPSSYTLMAARDAEKDQTYFLWTLTQEQLSRILFPIGHLEKPEVRTLAGKFGLPTAAKKDSQGLCFLGKLDMREFLRHFIPQEKGKVLAVTGEEIGVHEGAAYYTIGERRGFSVSAQGTHDTPRYIVKRDVEKNTLTVSADPKHESARGSVELVSANWIRGNPDPSRTYGARARYRQPLLPCTVSKQGERWQVHFKEPQAGIADGQSLVLYDRGECCGGGVIA